MQFYWGVEEQLHTLLTFVPDRGRWRTFIPADLLRKEPQTYWRGGWMHTKQVVNPASYTSVWLIELSLATSMNCTMWMRVVCLNINNICVNITSNTSGPSCQQHKNVYTIKEQRWCYKLTMLLNLEHLGAVPRILCNSRIWSILHSSPPHTIQFVYIKQTFNEPPNKIKGTNTLLFPND